MKKNIYLYPLSIRIWHLVNALIFLLLIISGISLQSTESKILLIDFDTVIQVHNICGLILTLSYLFFLIANFVSGNYRYYIPKIRGIGTRIKKQTKYHLWGIFRGEKKPFAITKENKFNPLQQITYFKVMYIAKPLIIITGLILLFPLVLEDYFGESGLVYIVFLHSITGYILLLFLIVHIYLGFTGTTIYENFKAIITGWKEVEEENQK